MNNSILKSLINEVVFTMDVSGVSTSEVDKLKDKNKNKEVAYTDDKPGDSKGLSEGDGFQRHYDELKKHFTDKGFDSALTKLEKLKDNDVKLLKLYNSYFRNPYEREDLFMKEGKIKDTLRRYLKEILAEEKEFGTTIGALESMPTDDDMILNKFPQVKEALAMLMGQDYKAFVKDIRYIAPKPTTFQIDLGDEEFNLMWVGAKTGFVAEVEGKNYFLNSLSEKQNAIKSVNRLLRVGTSAPEVKAPEEFGEEMGEESALSLSKGPRDVAPSDISPDELRDEDTSIEIEDEEG